MKGYQKEIPSDPFPLVEYVPVSVLLTPAFFDSDVANATPQIIIASSTKAAKQRKVCIYHKFIYEKVNLSEIIFGKAYSFHMERKLCMQFHLPEIPFQM